MRIFIWTFTLPLIFFVVLARAQFIAPSTDSVSAPGHSWLGDTTTGMFRPSVGVIGLGTSGAERLRVNATGVGIGTTSPARLLNVAGPVRINPAASPGSPAAGDLFIDSGASNALKYHNGSGWVSVTSGSTGIQAPVTTLATIGASCSNVGQLAKDASDNLLVCDDTPSALNQQTASCSAMGVGAMTIDETGVVYVCLN